MVSTLISHTFNTQQELRKKMGFLIINPRHYGDKVAFGLNFFKNC